MKTIVIAASLLAATGVWGAETPAERIDTSARVFNEIMSSPGKAIPQDLLNKANCVIIMPGLKQAAFIVGGEYGRGFAECRKPNGVGWAAPAALRLEGGSVGFQIGGSSADIVILVMNREGMDKLLQDKVTLGADASVAAGPVGRGTAAETNATMHAQMLAYSRNRGVFAGVALNGAVLQPDREENKKLYGREYTTREIVMGHVRPTAAAHPLIAELDRYSSYSNAPNAERAK
ncbi:MAG TPA: lipid-binding SYLF domain-containing protein [Bryobacteraceae bacterium]|nr:lipid-binding SYLF domain-containing protein [Bryobacteraceae bacterium]